MSGRRSCTAGVTGEAAARHDRKVDDGDRVRAGEFHRLHFLVGPRHFGPLRRLQDVGPTEGPCAPPFGHREGDVLPLGEPHMDHRPLLVVNHACGFASDTGLSTAGTVFGALSGRLAEGADAAGAEVVGVATAVESGRCSPVTARRRRPLRWPAGPRPTRRRRPTCPGGCGGPGRERRWQARRKTSFRSGPPRAICGT